MANTVYFIRHGETFFNKYHRMQGWSDTPLTEKGWADAAQAGRALADLDFDYLFSSDLKRTVDTANTILKNHPTEKFKHRFKSQPFVKSFLATLKAPTMTKAQSWLVLLRNLSTSAKSLLSMG